MSSGTIIGKSICCGYSSTKIEMTYSYAEGSILFDKKKAKKGILYAVAIKEVKIKQNFKTYQKIIPLYVDTLNSLWNESDLCIEADARSFALSYLIEQQELIIAKMEKC